MTDVNAAVVEQYAEHLTGRASSAVLSFALVGVASGAALGAIPGHLSHSLITGGVNYFAVLLGALAGGIAGRSLGEKRATGLRLEAQLALRQLQVEARLLQRAAGPVAVAPAPVAPAPVAPAPVAPAPVAPAPVAPAPVAPAPVAPVPVAPAPVAPALATPPPEPFFAPPPAPPGLQPVAPPVVAPAPVSLAPPPEPTVPSVSAPPAPPAPVAPASPRLVEQAPALPPLSS